MKHHAYSLINTLIGGVLWSSVSGCFSNPVHDNTDCFEYESFTFHPDSVTYGQFSIIPDSCPPSGHIDRTWQLIRSFAGDSTEADSLIDIEERISALRRDLRNGSIIRDYSWPLKDRASKWVIEAYRMYCLSGDRHWLHESYKAGANALDSQWDANYLPGVGLLRGEVDIPGLTEPTYPQWMRMPDKLSTIHLSTNVITVSAMQAMAAMADSLHIQAPRFSQRASDLRRAINRHMWAPATGTYAMSLYSSPYPVPCNTVDLPSLLLTITSGVAQQDVALFMLSQIAKNGPELIKNIQSASSIKWTTPYTATISTGTTECNKLLIFENGRLEQIINPGNMPQVDIDHTNRFTAVNIAIETETGTTGYSAKPHRIIPAGAITEIEAEHIGTPGTRLIRQKTMARRFIELTATKNSRISFILDEPTACTCIMELIYADGTSYQPWQLRNVIVNGQASGTIALPKLYNGPSTRGTSTTISFHLNEGSNYIVLDTTPLLPQRGSILLDKIRLIRTN